MGRISSGFGSVLMMSTSDSSSNRGITPSKIVSQGSCASAPSPQRGEGGGEECRSSGENPPPCMGLPPPAGWQGQAGRGEEPATARLPALTTSGGFGKVIEISEISSMSRTQPSSSLHLCRGARLPRPVSQVIVSPPAPLSVTATRLLPFSGSRCHH